MGPRRCVRLFAAVKAKGDRSMLPRLDPVAARLGSACEVVVVVQDGGGHWPWGRCGRKQRRQPMGGACCSHGGGIEGLALWASPLGDIMVALPLVD